MYHQLALGVSPWLKTTWPEIVDLPIKTSSLTITQLAGKEMPKTNEGKDYFDKSSQQISALVYKTWFSRYPHYKYIINDNGREFKLHFTAICNSCDIKHKPTNVKKYKKMLYWSACMQSLWPCSALLKLMWLIQ